MEDQVHKPHRKSKDKKDKKQHTGGKLFLYTVPISDWRILTNIRAQPKGVFLRQPWQAPETSSEIARCRTLLCSLE